MHGQNSCLPCFIFLLKLFAPALLCITGSHRETAANRLGRVPPAPGRRVHSRALGCRADDGPVPTSATSSSGTLYLVEQSAHVPVARERPQRLQPQREPHEQLSSASPRSPRKSRGGTILVLLTSPFPGFPPFLHSACTCGLVLRPSCPWLLFVTVAGSQCPANEQMKHVFLFRKPFVKVVFSTFRLTA